MDRPFIFKALLTSIIIVLPTLIWAKAPVKKEGITIFSASVNSDLYSVDSAQYQQQDKEKDQNKETPNPKQVPQKSEIKEIPKARRQSRPPVVVKPHIKVKPIKVIRPKIKKP